MLTMSVLGKNCYPECVTQFASLPEDADIEDYIEDIDEQGNEDLGIVICSGNCGEGLVNIYQECGVSDAELQLLIPFCFKEWRCI